MYVFLVIILFVLIALITQWYIKRNKFMKCLKNIPGPPPLPIIGNALDLTSTKVLLPKFLEYRQKYGGIVKLHIGMYPNLLIVSEYKLLEFILSSTSITDKSAEYRFLGGWLGTGLLLSDGNRKWKHHRKLLTPTFHFKILEQFLEGFENNAKILLKKLEKELEKTCTDIYPLVSLCTLDIICASAMGTSIHAQDDPDSAYLRSVREMCGIIIKRAFNPFLHTTFPYIFTNTYKIEKECIKILHDYTNSVIKKRKEEFEKNCNIPTDSEYETFGKKRRLAFLDLLLEERRKGQVLSDVDIREEVDTFMTAGHDTTASAICFALYLLAEHPEVQLSVINELQQIFEGDRFRNITFRDLQEMKYLEAVIKETLRLYPSVPFYGREIREDIEFDGTVLPKGLGVVIFAYGIHHNPVLFPEPEKFYPDRFLYENTTGKSPYGYIPFSAGPRNCIGQKYAMLEIKSVLTTILRNFEILPTNPKHNLELVAETVLKSATGICVNLKKRESD